MPTNLELTGVNLAGAEFDPPNGSYYEYPTQGEIDYEASKGMNVIRVPVEWERLQPSLGGALDAGQLGQLDSVVAEAAQDGVAVVIDLHNYGKYRGSLVGQGSVTDAQFADFWGRMAAHYDSTPNVLFGLMNEPAQTDANGWLGSVNAAIGAIRGAEGPAPHEVLVSGINYDGAWTWVGSPNDTVIAAGIADPANDYALEVHQYFDADGSGTSSTVATGSDGSSADNRIGVERLTAITRWAQDNGQRLFLGEVGVPFQPNPNGDAAVASQNRSSITALRDALRFVDRNAGAWQGFTYWAAGPLWSNYLYSAEPTADGGDAPQQMVLDRHAHSPTLSAAVASLGDALAGGGSGAPALARPDAAGDPRQASHILAAPHRL